MRLGVQRVLEAGNTQVELFEAVIALQCQPVGLVLCQHLDPHLTHLI